jgi:hypothetical protein
VAASGSDRPRLLHRRSEHGYTDRPRDALHGEPEAVPADYQPQLSDRARRDQLELHQQAWQRADRRIGEALDDFQAEAPTDLRLNSGVRAVRRASAAVGRRLGLSLKPSLRARSLITVRKWTLDGSGGRLRHSRLRRSSSSRQHRPTASWFGFELCPKPSRLEAASSSRLRLRRARSGVRARSRALGRS